MSKPHSEQLFRLVKSLTKSEKRQFKLFSKRISPDETKKFVSLFDAVDSMVVYDENVLRRKVPQIPDSQFANMKSHLTEQILRSLRFSTNKKHSLQQILTLLENASLLYDKCLYTDALHLIEKAKLRANKSNSIALLPVILELEKQAVKHSMKQNIELKSEQMIQETKRVVKTIANTNTFANLSLKLTSYYQKKGFIRNNEDLAEIKKYLDKNLPAVDEDKLSFIEKINFFQSIYGYYLFIHDFDKAYEIAQKWLELFNSSEENISANLEWYIRALNAVLVCQNKLNLYEDFVATHKQLIALKRDQTTKHSKNINLYLFKTIYIHEINRHFMLGEFRSGTKVVAKFQNELNEIIHLIDKHTELIFYYKIACLYFGSNNFKHAIKWLNHIINEPDKTLREDLHSFARILSLICYYELGDDEMVEMNIRSTFRFLLKKKEFGKYESNILKFLRDSYKLKTPKDVTGRFITLKNQMIKLSKDKFERRAFNYFDIITYLESKIENRTMEEIFKERLVERG